jgi:hypothetical protein
MLKGKPFMGFPFLIDQSRRDDIIRIVSKRLNSNAACLQRVPLFDAFASLLMKHLHPERVIRL